MKNIFNQTRSIDSLNAEQSEEIRKTLNNNVTFYNLFDINKTFTNNTLNSLKTEFRVNVFNLEI